MIEPVWDSSALFDRDRYYSTVEYIGESFSPDVCLCGCSICSSEVLRAIAGESSILLGNIVVTINSLLNPFEYANGDSPTPAPVRSTKIPVRRVANALLIPFNDLSDCASRLVPLIYNTFKPKEVTAFDSIHLSLFYGQVSVPAIYELSGIEGHSNFPIPNTIRGLSAGFLAYGEALKVPARVFVCVEEDFGPITENFESVADVVKKWLPIEVAKVAIAAKKLYSFKEASVCGIYS
jgi:hypothetical protein